MYLPPMPATLQDLRDRIVTAVSSITRDLRGCQEIDYRISDMDSTAENAAFPKIKYRNRGRTCSLCDTPGPVLFRIPSDENRQKEWFSTLKWNVAPEKLKYVLGNECVTDISPSPASVVHLGKDEISLPVLE
ncbi:hypothetical protein AVEN_141903-1 [Araneus ventricosus]|uniref:THAP-type domain-containing protein n=1 Tax=Araneus ventricosus TaxID=182803 RepID=A0A4Y2KLB1_ARAVE|nr:hypothetical protein AVEN_141903-1 [Araneus ventricosus]